MGNRDKNTTANRSLSEVRRQDSSSSQRRAKPRGSGLGYNLFWGVLLFSLYWNFHLVLVHVTNHAIEGIGIMSTYNNIPHHKLQHEMVKHEFMNGPGAMAPPPPPPPVSRNLTKDLEEMVDFASPELMLKTAWQGLVKARSKKTPYRIITNVLPRKRVKQKDFGVDDFSLSTHATVGRLDRLLEEYRRWDGPVSAAVYISSEQDIDILLAFIHDKGRILKDIAIHVLMEDLSFMSKQYPNNILR